jgi:SAM-dependent methyltransferase
MGRGGPMFDYRRGVAEKSVHPFPARMAPEIALNSIPVAIAGSAKTVLDPMCGSGTVLVAAVQRGHHAIGVDLDPLATRMSSVATTDLDVPSGRRLLEDVAKAARLDRKTRAPWTDTETRRFAEFWFPDRQRLQLCRLARAIHGMDHGPVRMLAEISLSRTIVTKAPKASRAADTSHSRPHRVCEISEYDVLDGFERAFTDLLKFVAKRGLAGSSEVHLGDCRTLSCVEDQSVDLVVTSPPYLNAIDYMRGHKLALIWLGYTVSELRNIRATSIGAERGLDAPGVDFADDLVAEITRDQPHPELLPTAVLHRYSHDLLLFAQQMARVMKPNSRLVAVVGNSSLRGNFIRNDRMTQLSLEHFGFVTEATTERALPENRRYMPMKAGVNNSSITNRMRTETVLAMSSPSAN